MLKLPASYKFNSHRLQQHSKMFVTISHWDLLLFLCLLMGRIPAILSANLYLVGALEFMDCYI